MDAAELRAEVNVAHELTINEFSTWLDGYKNAWETANAPAGVKLFTESATYKDSRFYPPHQGYNAIEEFWKDELIVRKENVRFSYEIMACCGDLGMCRWEATLTEFSDSGDPKSKGHSGIFLCRFATDKLVDSLEEWRVVQFI